MFCRNCGKEIPDWAEFCPECGSLVNKSNNESGMGESNNQKAFNSYSNNAGSQNYSPKKNNAVIIAIIIFAVVVVIAVAVIVAFGFLSYTKSPKVDTHVETVSEEMETTEIETTTSNDVVVVTKRDGYANNDYEDGNENSNSVVGDDNVASSDSDNLENSEYIIPDSDTRKITKKDLKGLSKDELRIARNEIYARHGRRFDDEELQEYFDSCSWYEGTNDPADFSEDELSATEKANRNTIIKYEEKKGYK